MTVIQKIPAAHVHGLSDEEVEAYHVGASAMAESVRDDLMDAQAELQTGLGMFRLDKSDTRGLQHDGAIEDYLAKSLAMLHALQGRLGCPMYQPATHPEVSA